METENGNVQENRYDAEGLRFERLENGRRTSFVYHNGELLHEEGREEQGTSYHLGAGIEAFRRGQELSYYHRDEQLSTALVTSGQGEIQNSYQYDELTEQYYLRARYYNPVLGRFMQENVYQGDGLNLYAYCGNNPVVYDDPSGYKRKACPPQGKISESVDEGGTGTRDIYRAVSPEELDDIFATGGFRARPDGRSFQAKEFENSFDETLDFANKPINLDKVAIVKVTIPENVYNQLHHMNLDRTIFKSGTPVVEPEMLDMFNESIISIEHAF